MGFTYDRAASGRRVAAYTEFLLRSYGTDADGLADIACVPRDEMAEYVNEADVGELDSVVLAMLANVTGISVSWLLAETSDAEPPEHVGMTVPANEFANDIPHIAEELRSITDDLQGVIYVLCAMAKEGTEAASALRNQARELDTVFAQLDSMADALEEME